MRKQIHISLAVAVLFLLFGNGIVQAEDNPPPEPSSALLGSADATASGAFAYRVPIDVPRARGPVPSLALAYNSQYGNGIAGMGWTISGIPAIVRVRGDGGMRFNGADTYAFAPGGWGTSTTPSQWLKPVVKASPLRYHLAEVEAGAPFAEFAAGDRCGDGPCYWLMRDGKGNTYYFGGTPFDYPGLSYSGHNASLYEPNNGITLGRGAVVWSLRRVADVNGNFFDVTYGNDGRTLWPLRVDYNLPAAGAEPKTMSVQFDYGTTNRGDVTPMPYRFEKLLRAIRVYAHCSPAGSACSLVRKYVLSHQIGSTTGNSVLSALQEFGSDGDSGGVGLTPHTFQYEGGSAAMQQFRDSGLFIQLGGCNPANDAGQCRYQTHVGDIDGDGRADLVRAYSGNSGQKIQYTCGSTNNQGLQGPVQTHTNTTAAVPYRLSTLADVNGDGKQDLLVVTPLYSHAISDRQISTQIAFGQPNCSLAPFQSASVDNISQAQWMSSEMSKWRVIPADLNGDGNADLVIYDEGRPSFSGLRGFRTLYYKLSTGSGLGSATMLESGSHWTLCQGQSFPPSYNFNGILATDVNGDGKSDIVAQWSGKEFTSDFERSYRGQMTVMTALGGSNGLGTPSEYCELGAPAPEVRWPSQAVRSGDMNGDGLQDLFFLYQGRPTIDGTFGMRYGRDLRFRLGSSGAGSNPIRVWAQDEFWYPYASLAENHLNQWDYHLRDISGDGIDDLVMFYRGVSGTRLAYSLGAPNGALGPLVGHSLSNDMSRDDGGPSNYNYRRWMSVLGDINGDGRADFVTARYGGCAVPQITYVNGTTSGLAVGVFAWTGASPIASCGDARNMHLRLADLNADGQDDFVLINDNGQELSVQTITYGVSGTNRPDLLRSINNGVGGLIAVDYQLVRDDPGGAVRPDLVSTCGGASGSITGPACGRPNAKPRYLVRSITRDNGHGFLQSTTYSHSNGRIVAGLLSQRADLGFQSIMKVNGQTNAYDILSYRQDPPFERRLSRVEHVRNNSHYWAKQFFTYATERPYPGIIAVGLTRKDIEDYEGSGVLVRTLRTEFFYDWSHLVPNEIWSGTLESGDSAVKTIYGYAHDEANWIIGKPISSRIIRRSAVNGKDMLLDMTRTSYKAQRPLLVEKHERILLLDSETSCAASGDPWSSATCGAEINSRAARWVAVFQNPVYDSHGNLTYSEGAHTSYGTLQRHQQTIGYDRFHLGRVESTTDALGHVVRQEYDLAGRPTTFWDKNNQPYRTIYDVYGRPVRSSAPGVAVGSKAWSYLGLTADGYRMQETTYPSATVGHTVDYYFDGFGELRKVVDASGAGTITTLRFNAYVNNQLVERRSLPALPGGSVKYIETRYDVKGRPESIRRVTASYALEKQLAILVYNGDGSTTHTDALNRSRRVYQNDRGLPTRVTDAAFGDTYYSYNTSLSLKQVTLPPGRTGNLIAMTNDSWGRRTSLDDPATGFTSYSYDDAGQLFALKRYTNPAMSTLTSQQSYTYDEIGRRLSEGDGVTVNVVYTYDQPGQTMPLGRLTSVADQAGVTKLGYDGRGNLIRKEITAQGTSTAYTYTYEYDDRDLLKKQTLPNGSQHEYLYTPDGLLSEFKRGSLTYTRYSLWNAFKQPGKRESFLNPQTLQFANTSTYTYDADQLLKDVRIVTKSGLELSNKRHTYDGVGNLRGIEDLRSVKIIGGVNTDETQTFEYDNLDRLTRACPVFGCKDYRYDPLGNMTFDRSSISYYACGAEKCIKSATGATTDWIAYHDSEGKRTRFDDYSATPTARYRYVYDERQQLKQVIKDGVIQESMEYNYLGERVKLIYQRPGGPTTTTWYYGDGHELRQSSKDLTKYSKTEQVARVAVSTEGLIAGQATRQDVLNNQQRPFLGDTLAGPAEGSYLKHPSHLGSATLITRIEDGTEVARQWFEPFGNQQRSNSVGIDISPFKFADREYDDFSKLYYLRGRYYHPKTMRFITADDRIVGNGLNGQGYNRFSYVLNNPLRYIDPEGHEPKRPGWIDEWKGWPHGPPPVTDGMREMEEAYMQERFGPSEEIIITSDDVIQFTDTLLHLENSLAPTPSAAPSPHWCPGCVDKAQLPTREGSRAGYGVAFQGGEWSYDPVRKSYSIRHTRQWLDENGLLIYESPVLTISRVDCKVVRCVTPMEPREPQLIDFSPWFMESIGTADSFVGAVENMREHLEDKPWDWLDPSMVYRYSDSEENENVLVGFPW
jgi:RHS repeat-associated protein